MAPRTLPIDSKSRLSTPPVSDAEGSDVKFVVILEQGGTWIWELRSPEGSAVCRSSMSYGDRAMAFKAIQAVRGMAPRALVFDPLGTLYEGI